MTELSRCFAPVSRPDARVLILGSLPGALSLARGEYYAHQSNGFWRIMSHFTGVAATAPYSDRLRGVVERRIALWDVCAQASRPGSLDADIDQATLETNDFATFFAAHNALVLIAFNGQKAMAIFRAKGCHALAPERLTLLPSTSPAHAVMSFDGKLARWRAALQDYL